MKVKMLIVHRQFNEVSKKLSSLYKYQLAVDYFARHHVHKLHLPPETSEDKLYHKKVI